MAANLPFQVSWSPETKAELRVLLREARNPIARNELARSIQMLNERLQRDPFTLGTVYNFAGVIREFFALVDPWFLDFAVDVQRHIVMVRSCHALWRGNGRTAD
jgi:hypothetical protein